MLGGTPVLTMRAGTCVEGAVEFVELALGVRVTSDDCVTERDTLCDLEACVFVALVRSSVIVSPSRLPPSTPAIGGRSSNGGSIASTGLQRNEAL